jgi:phospholipid/cholesterol/gamma-HCH transport system substrate-binding protein
MPKSSFETFVGTLVVLVAAIFLWMGYVSTLKPVSGGVVYKAFFDSTEGISINSDVKIGGVRIGTVAGIDISENYKILLTLRVQKKIKIPQDSSLVVATSGIMGDKYLSVVPGVATVFLQPGESFFKTKGPLNLENLVTNVVGLLSRKSF